MKNTMWNFNYYVNQPAFIGEDGTQLTYAELAAENEKLAAAIGSRCLVFVLCQNTSGAAIGYTAFLQNKMVPLLLSAQLDYSLLQNLITVYYPAYLWLPQDQADMFPSFCNVYESHGYVLLKTGFHKRYPMHAELGLLLTTSGSTGSPKFVRQSYANIKTNAKQIAQYLELDAKERPITTLPMNYTYGLSVLNSHLLVGATILLTDRGLMDRRFWEFFKTQRATSFGGVPYTYEMLEKLRFFQMDLPCLRTMTQAGGKLSPQLHKKFAQYAMEKGKQFVVMYGACEATARMGYLPHEKALEKYGSCGIAIPGGAFYLLDENGQVINTPQVAGELVYEGENVTMGYAECGADLAKGDERHGRLETGDIAKRDEDGFYYIVGRKKRFLKIYGNRVNLDEIDRMVKTAFVPIDCASTGVDDRMDVYLTDEDAAEKVRAFLAEKTGLNPAAVHTIAVRQIPRNDAGKVLYQKLAETEAAGRDGGQNGYA